jgi:superfamily I DNA and/or RNA helicase
VIPSPGSYVIRYYPIGSDETQLSDWSTWVHCLIFILEIGIITPYNYQVKLIEQRLIQRNLHQNKIEIGTGLFIC